MGFKGNSCRPIGRGALTWLTSPSGFRQRQRGSLPFANGPSREDFPSNTYILPFYPSNYHVSFFFLNLWEEHCHLMCGKIQWSNQGRWHFYIITYLFQVLGITSFSPLVILKCIIHFHRLWLPYCVRECQNHFPY